MAQAEAATSLLQGATVLPAAGGFLRSTLPPSSEIKKVSAAEHNVEGYTRLAEEKRTQALTASLTAEKTKSKAVSGKSNFEQESAAYDAAAEAWNDVVILYKSALEAATHAHLDSREIITFLREAEARELYWQANLVALEARKAKVAAERVRDAALVLGDSASIGSATEAEATRIIEAWQNSIKSYDDAISTAQKASQSITELTAEKRKAESEKAIWTEKNAELRAAAAQK